MKIDVCHWCSVKIKVSDSFNPKKDKAVCSKGCKDAEKLFTLHFSDEEINRRAHYMATMRGIADGQS